jgi:hypothetical protein
MSKSKKLNHTQVRDLNVQSADYAGLHTAIKIIKAIDDGEAPEYMACIEAIQAAIAAGKAGEVRS